MQADLTSQTPAPLWKRLVFGRSLKRTLIRAAFLSILAVIIFQYVLIPVRIGGISMEPTYHDGRANLVNRFSYLLRQPARGDIVAVRTSGRHIMYLKRIIGLPGESIAIERGVVFINGKPLAEPYLIEPKSWNVPLKQLKGDEYYLIGDNRRMPQEQHTFGVAQADHLMGKVVW